MQAEPHPTEDRCVLRHEVFTSLGLVAFRRAATDGTPVMIIPMGEREAAVPLRSLQREFAIDDDSPDGRMLGLIAESLDYVSDLHLGDALPSEVLTGAASWSPSANHRAVAAARLRVKLVAWLDPDAACVNSEAMLHLDGNPQLRLQVQSAFEQAARALGLASRQEVVQLVEDLAAELSYIEALREGLLLRVRKLVGRLSRMGAEWRGDPHRMESLTQTQRLSNTALRQFTDRFDEVDAQTGEVLAALGNFDSQQAFIRSNRDWLYRGRRAWDPILREWDYAGPGACPDEAAWLLIGRTYQFLAPRYMAVKEWPSFTGRAPRTKAAAQRMQW